VSKDSDVKLRQSFGADESGFRVHETLNWP